MDFKHHEEVYKRLLPRWQGWWTRVNPSAPEGGDAVFAYLAWLHIDPRRFYHTLDHLEACLYEFDAVADQFENQDSAELALWLHDAIYEANAEDRDHENEKRSQALAIEIAQARGLDEAFQKRVARHIIATTHSAVWADHDSRLVCDIDLTILGQSETVFDQYEDDIRAEYGFVPEAIYRTTRRRILQKLRDRKPLYQNDYFVSKYEANARRNLERSIARLK